MSEGSYIHSRGNLMYWLAPYSVYMRTDYFLMNTVDRFRREEYKIGVADLSDHCILQINMNSRQRNTVWRMNISVLNNPGMVEDMNEWDSQIQSRKKMRFLKQTNYKLGPKATKWLARWLRKQPLMSTIHKIRDPTTNALEFEPAKIDKTFEITIKRYIHNWTLKPSTS